MCVCVCVCVHTHTHTHTRTHTHTHTRTQARTHTHPIIYMLRRAHTELHGQAPQTKEGGEGEEEEKNTWEGDGQVPRIWPYQS
jgi:hypothetical protein